MPKQSVETQSTAPSTLADETAFTLVIEAAIKKTEQDFQHQLQTMQKELDKRREHLEKSIDTMLAAIIKQTRENSPFASKMDHTALQANVLGISTKMDSVQPPATTKPPRFAHYGLRDTMRSLYQQANPDSQLPQALSERPCRVHKDDIVSTAPASNHLRQ
jgi:hypothetical protein